jgi:glucose-6-phosphate isomerase
MTKNHRPQVVTQPARLEPDALLGRLTGGNGRYEKFLAELDGIYRDAQEFRTTLESDSGEPVYWVETSTLDDGDGALTIGVSTLKPGRIGDEFYMTRGHIHAKHSCAELYYGLRGRGVMLMETVDGETHAMEITPGVAVHVPGHWVHRSVNVGNEPFTTLFCYPTDAGQDYGIIGDAGGMKDLVVADGNGWALRPNPNHQGYGQGGPSSKDGDL